MKRLVSLVIIVLLIGFLPVRSSAQGCVVCTRAAAQLDAKSARGLNGGILYLAFLPLVILGTVGAIWWRSAGRRS